jgi:pilus assembly protein Flp/PilA
MIMTKNQNDVVYSDKKVKKQKGASLVEYALLAALIAVLCIIAMRALGNKVSTQFSAIASQL